ncbi:MAG: hypothetical protein JST48_10670 [Bacteroidetes bacterium]|nr:hypothetical protein [Bacteroidota bacterium]
MSILQKESISRLAVAFLELDPSLAELGDKALDSIKDRLSSYTVAIFCNEEIENSASQQAALLTAINVGKRCYKGGVFVFLKEEVKCLLNWPIRASLNEIAEELGARVNSGNEKNVYTAEILIGSAKLDNDKWLLQVNDWNAGIIPPGIKHSTLTGAQDFPLGGILGGALSIGLTFLKIAGFDHSIGSEAVGLSLWRPDLNWDDPQSIGPKPESFPNKVWILGLGHLGQAYTWALGLLPLRNPKDLFVKIQDDDRIEEGNYDSGMLSEKINEGEYKTRVCASWLESRGILTAIVERKYDEKYHRQNTDPEILLVGVDKLEARKSLKIEEFKLVLDCGLGAGLNFDMIRFNIFPNLKTSPKKFWENAKEIESTPVLKNLSQKLIGCGYTVGIASAFTGCVSACLIISEILRSYHQGIKLDHHYMSIRELSSSNLSLIGDYRTETFCGSTPMK